MTIVVPDAATAAPRTVAETAEILKRADASGKRVTIRGAGTELAWRATANADIVLTTTNLAAPIDHRAGDLVAIVPAGWTLDAVNRELARGGQRLPIDAPFPQATIGGIVATNVSGSLRYRHGAPRDLLIGIELVLADGRVARAGGQVVKNVAGYDLMRLLCGSRGQLAVITSATFKLAPLPRASVTVVAEGKDVGAMCELALMVAAAPAAPAAIELQAPVARLLIRFESTPSAAGQQAVAIGRLCEEGGATVTSMAGDDERRVWQEHGERIWGTGPIEGQASSADTSIATVAVLPTRVREALDAAGRIFGNAGLEWRAGGRVALGVVQVAAIGEPQRHARALDQLASAVHSMAGTIGVGSQVPEVQSASLGSAPGEVEQALIARVKAQFDARGTLI